LIQEAKRALEFNWTGEYTRPGPRLYPHQWSWDSAFIAIGYAHWDQRRAVKELTHLFESQWQNGLLPQLVFNPHFGRYFPGVGFWHADRNPNAPRDHKTSGVVQPPLHATATLRLYRRLRDAAGARGFLEYAYPRLKAWHEYLYNERDSAGEGLVYIRHPWESGMDNSPVWDGIMRRLQLRREQIPSYHRVDTQLVAAQDRPVSTEYDRFAYLVQLFAERDYDETRIRRDCPFLVQDVLFNTLLCQANRDLAEIARILGEDPAALEAQAQKTAWAIESKLWDEEHGIYLDFDLVAGQQIYAYVAANFTPLFAGIPNEVRARRMVETMESTGFGLGAKEYYPMPSYDCYGFGFSPVQYWRGPVWININWLLMHGLKQYGFDEHAERLRCAIVELCQKGGFYEYFDPLSGMGHGSDLFSWTAALLIDVLMDDGG
jgi:mannosylglycerate hydrolase